MDVNNTGTVSLGEVSMRFKSITVWYYNTANNFQAWIALQSNTKCNVSVADSLNAIHNSGNNKRIPRCLQWSKHLSYHFRARLIAEF